MLNLPDDFCLTPNVDICPTKTGGWRRCTEQEVQAFFHSQDRLIKLFMYPYLTLFVAILIYAVFMTLTHAPPVC